MWENECVGTALVVALIPTNNHWDMPRDNARWYTALVTLQQCHNYVYIRCLALSIAVLFGVNNGRTEGVFPSIPVGTRARVTGGAKRSTSQCKLRKGHDGIGLYRENAIAIESEARDPFGGNVYYVTMQITSRIPEFARKERNLHCDVVHATTKWVSRLVLDHAIAAIQTSR